MAPCTIRGCAVRVAVKVPAGTASAGNPTIERHPVHGGAEAFFGACPDTVATPAPGTVCVESYVLVRRGYAILGGGSIARSKLRGTPSPRRFEWSSPARRTPT